LIVALRGKEEGGGHYASGSLRHFDARLPPLHQVVAHRPRSAQVRRVLGHHLGLLAEALHPRCVAAAVSVVAAAEEL